MYVKAYQRAKSFFGEFDRKPGDHLTTHYCPGCGHGNLHKYIAEALDDFKVQDRTVFVNPVGCSVFAYYYFDVGNIQVAHGRAPAVATAVKRALPDSVVISYQGDGDLAAIGGTEIIHAANRGEHIAVFFVNNAIYGMTGGQMAPTTLPGQRTTSSPIGRDARLAGYPLKVCELISQVDGAAYVVRRSLHAPAEIRKAKKAIRQAFENQIAGAGFSLVELLSSCPTNWGMTPVEALHWIETEMVPAYPLGDFKNCRL